MNIGKITGAFALTLAVSTLPAMAINTRGQAGSTWNQNTTWDQNGDRVISRGEWRGDAATFERLDVNRDGILTRAEADAATNGRYGKNANRRFKDMDRDENGVITRDEWRGNDKSFEKQDRNRDGVISAADHGRNKAGKLKKAKQQDRDDD